MKITEGLRWNQKPGGADFFYPDSPNVYPVRMNLAQEIRAGIKIIFKFIVNSALGLISLGKK